MTGLIFDVNKNAINWNEQTGYDVLHIIVLLPTQYQKD